MEGSDRVKIGTSGYYYKDWGKEFYPASLPADQRIVFYSSYFDILELNYTYYRLPEEKISKNFIRHTGQKVKVSVKATNIFTHTGTYSPSDAKYFINAVSPFAEYSLLIGILFQFPYSFGYSRENMEYLNRLRLVFKDFLFYAEFRNNNWFNKENYKSFSDKNILLCSTDYPLIKGLPDSSPHLTGKYGYIRFHGRNAEKWYGHKHAYQRYNYSYSTQELAEWIPKISRVARASKETYIFFNNHYNANAVKNAIMLKELINKY